MRADQGINYFLKLEIRSILSNPLTMVMLRYVRIQARLPRLIFCAVLAWLPVCAANAAQDSKQLWGNYIIALPKSERFYIHYDFQGGAAVSGGNDSAFIKATGLAEYYPNAFADITGEIVTDFSDQFDAENYFEGAVRIGLRLHLINQIFNSPLIKRIRPERVSAKRFAISNLARIEYRQFWYSGDTPSGSDTRFRDRLQLKLAINRPSLAADGVWYALTDAEWFESLDDYQQGQRLPSKIRYRVGIGYRSSYTWRFETMAIKDVPYDLDNSTVGDTYAVNLRIKHYF